MTDKPTEYPDWALIKTQRTTVDPETGKIAQGESRSEIPLIQKDFGFDPLEGVERANLNQVLYLNGQFVRYFDERLNKPQTYTNSGKPSASSVGAGSMIYISDIDSGGCIAFSDGTNFRKIKDNSIII